MSTIRKAAKIIEECQASSMQCWGMAVDTAETPERKAAFEADMQQCDAAYDSALEHLERRYEGWLGDSKNELETARSLEKDGGDDQHARRALAALADLTEDSDV